MSGWPVATATGISDDSAPSSILPLPKGSNASGLFVPGPRAGTYTLNLSTTGLAAGQYALHLIIAGDPTPHTLMFAVA